MRIIKFILLALVLLFFAACHSNGNNSDIEHSLSSCDSVFIEADLQWHQQYYPGLDYQVFSLDLLSNGLAFDSAYHISGTGYNLYLSDVFLPSHVSTLQDGTYRMDTTAQPYTFLPYLDFEGEITGTYLLDINTDKIRRIIGFTDGEMTVQHDEDLICLDIILYIDSTHTECYHATYRGAAIYR